MTTNSYVNHFIVRCEDDFYVEGSILDGTYYNIKDDVVITSPIKIDGASNILIAGNGYQIRREAAILEWKETKDEIFECTPIGSNTFASNFPILLVDNEYREMMSYKGYEAVLLDVEDHLWNDADGKRNLFKIKLNWLSERNKLIKEGSILFLHILWLTYRCEVLECCNTSIESCNYKSYTYKLKINGYVYLDDAIGSTLYIDIYNPNIDIENNLEEGKYIFTSTTLYYKATSEEIENGIKCFSYLNQTKLMEISDSHDVIVTDVHFEKTGIEDITFNSGRQAEGMGIPCISIHHSSEIAFKKCLFSKVMGYCIGVDCLDEKTIYSDSKEDYCFEHGYDYIAEEDPTQMSSNIQIENNIVNNTHGGGFLLNNCKSSNISNNRISNFGKLQHGAVGITIRNANNICVENNTVYNGPYTGISVGWSWNRQDTICHDVRVAYNHIHHCMRMVSDDGGGIYCMADCHGTVLENNIVHDIISRNPDQAAAIYMDEACHNIKVYNNICYGCDRFIHLHYGEKNEIYNNIFAYCNTSGIRISLYEENKFTMYLHNNIFVIDSGIFLNASYKSLYAIYKNLFDLKQKDHTRFIAQDTHKAFDNYIGVTSKLVGNKDSLLSFTQYGIKRNKEPNVINVHGFMVFDATRSFFQMFPIIENPSLCGFQQNETSDIEELYTDEEKADFATQRNQVLKLKNYSIIYFKES